jgi:hypothetical protein
MTLAMITFLAGGLLGMRFKCLVLAPGLALVIAAIFAGGIVHHEDAGSIALAITIASIGLQAGYLGGLFVSDVLADRYTADRQGRRDVQARLR